MQKIDRNSHVYRKWKADVIEKDGHKCVRCGATEHLEAHHIKPYAKFPELATNLDNGITLCRKCHAEEHNKRYGKDEVIADQIAETVHPFFLKLRDITFYISYRSDILKKFWRELPLPNTFRRALQEVSLILFLSIIFGMINLVKSLF